jgi:hypothetical protein
VCFAAVLDAAGRQAVAHALQSENMFYEVETPWRWCELDGCTWAALHLENDADRFYEVRVALQKLHENVPIDEVILATDIEQEEGPDEWTSWSQQQATAKTRVPELAIETEEPILWYAGRTIVPVETFEDEAFEETLKS